MMFYEDYETIISHDTLSKVITALPPPVCLLGGWAIYYTVNTNYSMSTGRSYHGSKDIDLGFHLESVMTDELLYESSLAKSIRSLEDMGFRSVGVRMFKEYHRETHLLLSESKAKKTPSYNIFQLYIDIMADNIHQNVKKTLGFTPVDEKRLVHVFKGKMFKVIDEFPIKVIVPTPPVLLSMKIASLPERTKDHKKHKDIMDVYALIWYSGVTIKKLRFDVSKIISDQEMSKMLSSIDSSDYSKAANALDIDERELENVIKGFVRAPVTMGRSKDGWALPTNMSYDRFIMIVKALIRLKADQRAVDIEKVSKRSGLITKTAKKGVSFLESVGVVERSDRNYYNLTTIGTSYAKAHLNENIEQIRNVTLEIINQSHLADLADLIKNSKKITKKDLYKSIKGFGRFADGKSTGGMHSPFAMGATTVLRLFVDADLIDKGLLELTPKKTNASTTALNTSSSHSKKFDTQYRSVVKEADHSITAMPFSTEDMDDQAFLAVKGVGQVQINDLETLKMAEMYMTLLRKKLSRVSASSRATNADDA